MVKGKGVFTIGSVQMMRLLEMKPYVPHAIEALEELEFVVVHMYFREKPGSVVCGADNGSS